MSSVQLVGETMTVTGGSHAWTCDLQQAAGESWTAYKARVRRSARFKAWMAEVERLSMQAVGTGVKGAGPAPNWVEKFLVSYSPGRMVRAYWEGIRDVRHADQALYS